MATAGAMPNTTIMTMASVTSGAVMSVSTQPVADHKAAHPSET
jgi:hypothetical protein